jgi:hypothetical protein
MATKAQAFRAEEQRSARVQKPKAAAPKKRRSNGVDTSQPGVSATDRKVGGGSTATRNASNRAKAKGGAKLEDSATGKPSRKSTRKSEGHAERTSKLRQRAVTKARSPKARAARARVKA